MRSDILSDGRAEHAQTQHGIKQAFTTTASAPPVIAPSDRASVHIADDLAWLAATSAPTSAPLISEAPPSAQRR